MSGKETLFWIGIGLLLVLGIVLGDRSGRQQWRECRTLLATRDSATVIAARPDCADWTWPQPVEAKP